MRWCEWTQLKPGMKVVTPIYGKNQLLLSAGMELNWNIIHRLPIWGIFHLLVDADRSEYELIQRYID